jgi:hypothetical protein
VNHVIAIVIIQQHNVCLCPVVDHMCHANDEQISMGSFKASHVHYLICPCP